MAVVTHCGQCGQKLTTSNCYCFNCDWYPGKPTPLPRTQVHVCPKCDGEGVMGGPFLPANNGTQRTCPTCHGRGFATTKE